MLVKNIGPHGGKKGLRARIRKQLDRVSLAALFVLFLIGLGVAEYLDKRKRDAADGTKGQS